MISLTCVSPFLSFIMNILLILKLVSAKYVSNSFKPVTKLRSTSVLERGVTIKNLQVIVFNAEHELYDEKSLIQISGRVGRKIDA